MMRLLLYIIVFFQCNLLVANMAEPVERGTLGARPFTNQFVDVLSEDLLITIDENFEKAKFEITYTIQSLKDGINIPLLFYASELGSDLLVTVDGKEIAIQDIPDELYNPDSTKFDDFSYFFDKNSTGQKYTWIRESPNHSFGVQLNDFKYFETDISKGRHVIHVSYTANQWVDKRNWVKVYNFRYALSSAKYWRSFGVLNLTINSSAWNKPITINIGDPISGKIDSIAHWSFDGLPTEILKISYTPQINKLAEFLITLEPFKLAILVFILIVFIHVFLIKKYRKKYMDHKYSWVVIVGSITIPFLFLVTWILFYFLIDLVIGKYASGTHGYTFLVIILYPLIMPIYWLIMWGIDKVTKNRIINHK